MPAILFLINSKTAFIISFILLFYLIYCTVKEYRIEPSLIECDFYDYLDDKPYAVKVFHGEYMTQYSWAEKTLGKYL